MPNSIRPNLIILAHFGEAQSFVQELSLVQAEGSSHFFESENVDLLISGEGSLKALIKTMKILGKRNYNFVINAGVAGSLRPLHSKGHVVTVRTAYHSTDNHLHFQSFPLLRVPGIDPQDNLTVDRRLHFMDGHDPLRAYADIIDRELWGIAQACHEYQVPLLSIKTISDHVLDSSPPKRMPDQGSVQKACENVRADAFVFSKKLFRVYLDNVQPHLENLLKEKQIKEKFREEVVGELFQTSEYLWTHSLRAQFEALLELSLRRGSTLNEIKSWLRENSDFVLMEKKSSSRKEKTKNLMRRLEELL
jgi:nucleoside phosphorylase